MIGLLTRIEACTQLRGDERMNESYLPNAGLIIDPYRANAAAVATASAGWSVNTPSTPKAKKAASSLA